MILRASKVSSPRCAEHGITVGGLVAAASAALAAKATTFTHAGFQFATGPNEMNAASYHVDLLDSTGGRLRILDLVPDPPVSPRSAKAVLPISFVDAKSYLPK